MQYRAEIDGLRALAVVPVVLFHAGFEIFSGGFVGVDVFFVISGYLITTLLIEDIENNRFSITRFYEKRARRILPALFFVMLICIPFAWIWMLPEQMTEFAKSLLGVSFFVSNIIFWRQSGYFDSAAEEKPLLHTWSLAVEEQYYLIFPVFLLIAWRFGRNKVFWLIVIMAALSLLLSEFGWRHKPSANFFLTPTRAWELFSGSIAAFLILKTGIQKNERLALIGLLAILFSIFFYDEQTPFPSIYTAVPVLGTVLIVLYASQETLAAKILRMKPFVGIGLISYSAYLWHQPLFAFLRITGQGTVYIFGFAAVFSFGLAYFTWRYIENPFREHRRIRSKIIFILSLSGIVFFACIGIYGLTQEGFPDRYKNNKEYDELQFRLRGNFGLSEKCDQNFVRGSECATSVNPDILVWGDSYAMHLVPGIISSKLDSKLHQATVSQCAPILGYAVTIAHYGAMNCIKFNDIVFDWLKNSSVKYVILSSPFSRLTDNKSLIDRNGTVHTNGAELTYLGVTNLVQKIRELGKIPVIVTPPPTNGTDLGQCLLNNKLRNNPLELCDFDESKITNEKLEVIRQLKNIPNANIINLKDIICIDKICKTSINGVFLYRDSGHLSYEGSAILGERFNLYKMSTSFIQ